MVNCYIHLLNFIINFKNYFPIYANKCIETIQTCIDCLTSLSTQSSVFVKTKSGFILQRKKIFKPNIKG